ncbi:hypothetical protein KOI35_24105 [Actinoplanes bogorensis]|uniref:Uncharacterized protein n=1 Tax=Paractinoplanes bogorensis TaxID=1610840 RepID=A0ABS5YT12_9ACTN|nr:hypothetical protein [Actinoplanes bogorensis]MBU2666596.1 hypothetical protein [Actinoplanes bogorensis]
MTVSLGPYPLCAICRQTNGGLVAVSHRQFHLRAHGKEACVDQGLAGLIDALWAVCDTRSCCEQDGDRAYVVPEWGSLDAAHEMLVRLGLKPTERHGILYFEPPATPFLSDPEQVQNRLRRPATTSVTWRVTGGKFQVSAQPAANG